MTRNNLNQGTVFIDEEYSIFLNKDHYPEKLYRKGELWEKGTENLIGNNFIYSCCEKITQQQKSIFCYDAAAFLLKSVIGMVENHLKEAEQVYRITDYDKNNCFLAITHSSTIQKKNGHLWGDIYLKYINAKTIEEQIIDAIQIYDFYDINDVAGVIENMLQRNSDYLNKYKIDIGSNTYEKTQKGKVESEPYSVQNYLEKVTGNCYIVPFDIDGVCFIKKILAMKKLDLDIFECSEIEKIYEKVRFGHSFVPVEITFENEEEKIFYSKIYMCQLPNEGKNEK